MAKTLDAMNLCFGDDVLDQVTGIDWSAIRERMRREGADSVLVRIDGEPVILREPPKPRYGSGTTAR